MRLSLFFFLHLVALVILLIVHPHARADDGWAIADGDKDYIYLTKNGEYLYGDRLIFSLKYYLQIYTQLHYFLTLIYPYMYVVNLNLLGANCQYLLKILLKQRLQAALKVVKLQNL